MYIGEYLVVMFFEVGCLGQIDQQCQCFVGDVVFVVVDVEIVDVDGEFLVVIWIVGEELVKMGVFDLIVMFVQGVLCWGSGDVGDWCGGYGLILMLWSGVDQSCCFC